MPSDSWWLGWILSWHADASVEHAQRCLFLLMLIGKDIVLFLIWSAHLLTTCIILIEYWLSSTCNYCISVSINICRDWVASHFAIHKIIDKSLTPIEISSQIITDLYQSIAFILKPHYLTLFRTYFTFKFSYLLLAVSMSIVRLWRLVLLA